MVVQNSGRLEMKTLWGTLQTNWNEELMPEVGDVADFLSVHSYFSPYDSDSPADVILNTYTVPEDIISVLVNDMAETGQVMLPVAMTEWNIWAAGSMQQVSHINGLLATMVLGEFVKNDYGMGMRWDFINGWSGGDTHALFSTGEEPGVDPYNPRAPFYYMYFFQKYFGDRMIGLSHNGNSNIVAYASSFSSGETSLAIVNKGSSDQTTSIVIENFDPGIRYYTMTLTGDDVSFSRKVYLNGVGTNEQGGGPDNYPTVKAHASEIEGGITIDLPAYSAVFVIADKKGPLSYVSSLIEDDSTIVSVKFSEAIKVNSAIPAFEILVGGTTPLTVSGVEIDASDDRILHISVVEEVVRENALTISYSGSEITSLEDLVVAPFSDMLVKNNLIGDPYTITFRIKNTESENVIQDCKVTFNGVDQNTDAEGEAQFTEQSGTYNLSAEKIIFSSIENLEIRILSDTLINLQLDSAYFEVAFIVKDHSTSENLSYVDITGNGQTQKTDADGNAILNIHGGSQSILFEKINYTNYQEEFQIVSDTSLAVTMERSAADIKFSLHCKGQPVSGAQVTLDTASMLTSLVGVCTFKSIPLNSTYDYEVEKLDFFPNHGRVELLADKTIELEMEKSVANIEFVISAESGTIMNALVSIDQDTSWFNTEGVGRFYKMPINNEYAYKIVSDNFSVARGNVLLEKDTSINVLLTVGEMMNIYDNTDILIYPNPATERINIETSTEKISEIAIYDISGKQQFVRFYKSPIKQTQLDINLPAGSYLLSIKADKNCYRSNLIIQ
jgi:hypothetical protein